MKRILIYSLLIGIILSAFNIQAQDEDVSKVGTTAAKFLSIPVGARALALGGAYVSMADDASAMYWNPGALDFVGERQLFFVHSEWLADINFEYLAIAFPTTAMGTFGLSVTAMVVGEMEVTTEQNPNGTGQLFDASSFAFGLTYAKRLTDDFSIGGNIKLINEQIWNSSATGVALDIGTLFTTPFYGIRLGSSISNFGTKMQISGSDLIVQQDIDPSTIGNNESVNAILSTDDFDLPLNLKIGLSRDFALGAENRVTLAVDAFYPNDNEQSLNFGGEVALFDERIFLRGGYRSLYENQSEQEYTLGGGLKQKIGNGFGINLDYAYQSYIHLKEIHNFSINLSF